MLYSFTDFIYAILEGLNILHRVNIELIEMLRPSDLIVNVVSQETLGGGGGGGHRCIIIRMKSIIHTKKISVTGCTHYPICGGKGIVFSYILLLSFHKNHGFKSMVHLLQF